MSKHKADVVLLAQAKEALNAGGVWEKFGRG